MWIPHHRMTLSEHLKKIKCDFELVSQSHFASKFMTAVNFSSFNVTILWTFFLQDYISVDNRIKKKILQDMHQPSDGSGVP